MMLKKTAVAVALSLGLVVGANAHAAVPAYDHYFNFGTLIVPNSAATFVTEAAGSFIDKLSFSVASNTFAGGSVSSLSIEIPGFGALYNITGLSVKLYNGDTNALIGDLDSNAGSTPNQKVGSNLFTPGNYYFTVAGNATGSLGGQYVFAATTLPVPEPESYAMLLAGLGLMGTIARRRSKAPTA